MGEEGFDDEYLNHLSCWFYIQLFFYNRMPLFLWSLCCTHKGHSHHDEFCFEKIVDHFEELNNQVNYQLSVRNLTTSTLVGQLAHIEREMLKTNWSKNE